MLTRACLLRKIVKVLFLFGLLLLTSRTAFRFWISSFGHVRSWRRIFILLLLRFVFIFVVHVRHILPTQKVSLLVVTPPKRCPV